MNQLRNNVGYFKEKGGTVGWLINEEGIVVVDTQFVPQAHNLKTGISLLSSKNIDVLFNTHHHKDHTSGNVVFKEMSNQIVAHKNSHSNQMAEAICANEENESCFPNVTFEKDYKVSIGKESVSAFYYGPAHTNGDIVIHFEKANVLHIGDLVYNRCYPYIDKKYGASIQNWTNILEYILGKYDDDAIFIAGHALPGFDVIINKEDIKAFIDYLEKLILFGQDCKQRGIPKDVTLQMTSHIPGVTEWSGEGIERSIHAMYEEM
jgi:cyclase